ncbi:MAG: GNAT family N-acetyltransferase, partial [Clostridia bacterium]
MIEIKKLTDKNDPDIEKICDWLFAWWGEFEGFTKEKMRAYVTNSLMENKIPQTFGAFDDGQLVGIYQFSMQDCEVRPDIYPWLINVFVEKSHRGHGIFKKMMESIPQTARDVGIKTLFLFTDHVDLYEKFGWKFVELFKIFNCSTSLAPNIKA